MWSHISIIENVYSCDICPRRTRGGCKGIPPYIYRRMSRYSGGTIRCLSTNGEPNLYLILIHRYSNGETTKYTIDNRPIGWRLI